MQFQERLKSFVLRKGRLTANQKEALSNFKDKYLIDDSFELDTLRNNKVIALDIGFGSGERAFATTGVLRYKTGK